jgi:predicted HicB family RNase H-like nuclease
MSKSTYPLKLPTSVKKAAAELAATDGVSLNQFIAAAVAEKVVSLRVDSPLRLS